MKKGKVIGLISLSLMVLLMNIFVTVTKAQDPPKKKQKETEQQQIPYKVMDTVTVTIVTRPVVDSISMVQKMQIKELKEQVELQKQMKR